MPIWLIPIAPLIAAIVAGVSALTRKGERSAPFLTIAGTALAGFIALQANPGEAPGAGSHSSFTWLSLTNRLDIALGVHIDALTWIMLLVVCIVSALVQIYSIGYMKDEQGYARYFAYLGLFTASMIGLVVADNLFQLYVCWELVGVCSYLLVGFWWQKPSAAAAAKKAFVVTRFGDVGFMLGVLLLASGAGSFQYADVGKYISDLSSGAISSTAFVGVSTFLWLAPLLLFCGAVGKSAQFPLHVWLPDAMEGPTPVSALIHAATMVAAGVYMVARLSGIFAASTVALNVVLLIGAITALIAATIALVQYDIKKVLAYSTISQLGYMMMGLGAGGSSGTIAGMFHLTTHAFFKALLFLAAGSVIFALHHSEEPNDLRRMGGLSKRMPWTAVTCGIGVLALAGFPLLSGFWSKDSILAVLLERGGILGGSIDAGADRAFALLGSVVGILVAGITAFYAMRMWLLAFACAPRSSAAEHAHESPGVMIVPLVVLSVPSVGIGYFLHSGHRFAHLLGAGVSERGENLALMAFASLIALTGMGLAWKLYGQSRQSDPIEAVPGYGLFVNLWGIEGFWQKVGAQGSLMLGKVVALFDRKVVDGAVNGVGALCMRAGVSLRRSANGQAQSYALAMMIAALLVAGLLVLSESASSVAGARAPISSLTRPGGMP